MSENVDTICVQGGYQPGNGESRTPPIIQATTFKYQSSEQMSRLFDLSESGYFYTRLQNPTNDTVAAKICELFGEDAANVLRDVVGVGPRSRHLPGQTVDAIIVPPQKPFECAAIAGERCPNVGLVIVGHRSGSGAYGTGKVSRSGRAQNVLPPTS